MSNMPTIDLLKSLNVSKDRGFGVIDGNGEVNISSPVISKKNTQNYAVSPSEMSENLDKIRIPLPLQVAQNIARSALIYSASVQLDVNNPYHSEMNQLRKQYAQSITNKMKASSKEAKEAVQLNIDNIITSINQLWGERFNELNANNKRSQTISYANEVAKSAINELCENDEFKGSFSPQRAMSDACVAYIEAYTQTIVKDKNHKVGKEAYILDNYYKNGDITNQFLLSKYGDTDQKNILRTILVENAGVLDGDSINCDSNKLADMLIPKMNNDSSERISNLDMNKCALPSKKARGFVSGYFSPDSDNPQFISLNTVIGRYDKGDTTYTSHFINLFKEDPLNPQSPSQYAKFVKEGVEPKQVATAVDIDKHRRRAEEVRLEAIQNEKEQILVDRDARNKAVNNFLSFDTIESSEQLAGTYWDQKGLSDLVVKHTNDLRVSSDGTVHIPLSKRISNAEINNTRAFQQTFPDYRSFTGDENDKTNKKFEAMATGDKKNCYYTIGDPNTASVIITSEGIANGLLSYDGLKEKGIDACVVCALDVGNINEAIRSIIIQHPTKPIINFADNDRFTRKGEERQTLSFAIGSAKDYNVGETKATELNKAIGLPFISINFENIDGESFLNEQKQNKYSDIDDLIKAKTARNIENGMDVEASKINAKNIANEWLFNAVASELGKIDSNWSLENQHQTKWCGDTSALNNEKLSNYYYLKEPIQESLNAMKENSVTELGSFSEKEPDYLFSDYESVKAHIDNVNNEVMGIDVEQALKANEVKAEQTIVTEVLHEIPQEQNMMVQSFTNPIALNEQLEDINNRINLTRDTVDNLSSKIDSIDPSESDLKANLFERQYKKLELLEGELEGLLNAKDTLEEEISITSNIQVTDQELTLERIEPEIQVNTEPVDSVSEDEIEKQITAFFEKSLKHVDEILTASQLELQTSKIPMNNEHYKSLLKEIRDDYKVIDPNDIDKLTSVFDTAANRDELIDSLIDISQTGLLDDEKNALINDMKERSFLLKSELSATVEPSVKASPEKETLNSDLDAEQLIQQMEAVNDQVLDNDDEFSAMLEAFDLAKNEIAEQESKVEQVEAVTEQAPEVEQVEAVTEQAPEVEQVEAVTEQMPELDNDSEISAMLEAFNLAKNEIAEQAPEAPQVEEVAEQAPEVEQVEAVTEQTPEAPQVEEVAEQAPEVEQVETVTEQTPEVEQVETVAEQAPEAPQVEKVAEQTPEVEQVETIAEQAPEAPQVETVAEQAPEAPQVEEVAEQAPEVEQVEAVTEQTPEAPQVEEVAEQAPEVEQVETVTEQAPEAPQVETIAEQALEATQVEEVTDQTPIEKLPDVDNKSSESISEIDNLMKKVKNSEISLENPSFIGALEVMKNMQKSMHEMVETIKDQNAQLHETIKDQNEMMNKMREEISDLREEIKTGSSVVITKEQAFDYQQKLESSTEQINVSIKNNPNYSVGKDIFMNYENPAIARDIELKTQALNQMKSQFNDVDRKLETASKKANLLPKQSQEERKAALDPSKNVNVEYNYAKTLIDVQNELESIPDLKRTRFRDLSTDTKNNISKLIEEKAGFSINRGSLISNTVEIRRLMQSIRTEISTDMSRGMVLGAMIKTANDNCEKDFSPKATTDYILGKYAANRGDAHDLADKVMTNQISMEDYYSTSKELFGDMFEQEFASEIELVNETLSQDETTIDVDNSRVAPTFVN